MSFRVRMASPASAEVWLYDEIGEDMFGGISAKRFADELKALGKMDVINLRVNSPGGDVFDAVAIYNTLLRQSARVEVDIDGMALSAASIVIMAGDEIRMAENAMLMIHDAWTGVVGTSKEFRAAADLLDQIGENIVATYKRKTKASEERIRQMMASETWMRAAQALEEGFVDRITTELAVAAHFDKKRFRNIPKYALERASGISTPRTDLVRAKVRDISKRAAAIGIA